MPILDLGSVVGPAGPQGVQGPTGQQGVQGSPGPNQVTAATSTTFGSANYNAVLTGNGSKVGSKPFDSEPTANSQNMLTSGAVATALEAKPTMRVFNLQAGQTLTITLPNSEYYGSYGMMLVGTGTASTQMFAAFAIGRGNNTSNHIVQNLWTASSIAITDNGGTLTVKNNHGSWNVYVSVLIFYDSGSLAFDVS